MKTPEKRMCKSPCHPHKQKWYWYEEGMNHPDYCSSCKFALETTRTILGVVLNSMHSLYGEIPMRLTREQVHVIVDNIYDEVPTIG